MNFHKKIATLTICFASLQMNCNDEAALNLIDTQETTCSHDCKEAKVVSTQEASQLIQNLTNDESSDFTLNNVKYRVQVQSEISNTDTDAQTVVITCENRDEVTTLLNNCAQSLVDGDTLSVDGNKYIVQATEETTPQTDVQSTSDESTRFVDPANAELTMEHVVVMEETEPTVKLVEITEETITEETAEQA